MSALNGTEKLYVREKLCASGVKAMEGSRMLRMSSEHTKTKLATAFLDIADANPQIDDSAYEEFRLRCQAMGVPLVVIIFALNVAFQLLLEWWRRRNPANQ